MLFNRKDFLDSAWDTLTDSELQEWKRSLWTFPRGSETTGRLWLYREFQAPARGWSICYRPYPSRLEKSNGCSEDGLPTFGGRNRPIWMCCVISPTKTMQAMLHWCIEWRTLFTALKDGRKDLFNAMCKTEGSKFLCLNATEKVLLILKLAQNKFVNLFFPCTPKDAVHSF